MPALPNVPNVLKITLDWAIDGDSLAQTIHHALYSGGPPNSSNCTTMAQNFVSAAETAFQSLCHASVGVSQARVMDLSSNTGGDGEGGTAWTGTESGGLLSPGTAVLINHLIARRYRGGKPRSYIPMGTSSDLASTGLWLAASVTNFTGAWGDFQSGVIGGGSGCAITQMVNVSYYKGFTVVTSPTTGRARNVPTLRSTPVVDNFGSSAASVVVGSQRRRNRDA